MGAPTHLDQDHEDSKQQIPGRADHEQEVENLPGDDEGDEAGSDDGAPADEGSELFELHEALNGAAKVFAWSCANYRVRESPSGLEGKRAVASGTADAATEQRVCGAPSHPPGMAVVPAGDAIVRRGWVRLFVVGMCSPRSDVMTFERPSRACF